VKTETIKKIIKCLENTASKDPNRYSLGCVQITPKMLISTDGHIFSQVLHQDDALSLITEAYVNRDMLPFLKAVVKLAGKLLDINAVAAGELITIDGKEITSKEKVNYPNWKQLLPTFTDTAVIGIDANLLFNLVDTLKESKKHTCKLTFKLIYEKNKNGTILKASLDTTSPIQVTTANDNLGVIMPVRV